MKDEAVRLLAKAERSINAAKVLLQANEPDFAVGRVYYAMFYTAEALLVGIDQRFRKHSAVHAAFGERFSKPGTLDPKFHRWLLDAFDRRIVSDYDIEGAILPAEALRMIEQANEFLAEARRVLNQSQ